MHTRRRFRLITRGFDGLRRRPGSVALGAVVAAVLVAATVSVLLGGRHHGDFVQTRAASRASREDTTPAAPDSSTSDPSTTVAPTTTGTVASEAAPVTTPTTSTPSPWQVGPTEGLTNLAPVTITATGIPSDTYYVGQCPAGQAPSFDACVLNDAVVASDGTLTSTVHAFWWLKGGQIDCGSAPGACVVGAMRARDATVVASFPISFDPARRPTITVTPTDSLTDGQTVVVRGFDIGEGGVEIGECLLPGDPACTYRKSASGPDGTFRAVLTVSRVIDWWGRGGPVSSTCGVDAGCVVEVWLTPKGFDSQTIWINPAQPVGLQFAPGSLPTSTTSTSTSPTTTTTPRVCAGLPNC